MSYINRTENKLLKYYDQDSNPIHPTLVLGEDVFLKRAISTGEPDEDGNTATHVGWILQDINALTRKEIDWAMDSVWVMLTDIPTATDAKTGDQFITEDFYIWLAGTYILDIWAWFDRNYTEGLGNRHFNKQ